MHVLPPRSLDRQFVTAMDNMTSAGVNELRDKFLALPKEQRPDCFFRSLFGQHVEKRHL